MLPLKKGDVVASIGSGTGNEELTYAEYTKGVKYYLQDLRFKNKTKYAFRFLQRKTVVDENENSFKIINGSKTKTKLPDKSFDYVIMSNAFHEFGEPNLMLKDIKTKLKPEGKIIVIEHFSNSQNRFQYAGCERVGYTIESISSKMGEIGYSLSNVTAPITSIYNALTFEKTKQSEMPWVNKFNYLDSLSFARVILDSTNFSRVEELTVLNQGEIDSIYVDFPLFLYETASNFSRIQNFKAAQKLLELKSKLYNNSILDNRLLGINQYMNGEFEKASETFDKVVEPQSIFRLDKSHLSHFKEKSIEYQKRNYSALKPNLIKLETKYFKRKIAFNAISKYSTIAFFTALNFIII